VNNLNNHLLWHFAAAGALLVVAFGAATKDRAWAELAVPLGQAAGSVINPPAVQSSDLQTAFSVCESIGQQESGLYGLKPALRAGQATLKVTSIGGRVLDGSTHTPIPGAMVLLEQPDPANSPVDRVVRNGLTAQNGTFLFCSLPSGRYDVVASAAVISNLGIPTTYSAAVTLKVPIGVTVGDIPLVPEPQPLDRTTPSAPATISGQITSGAAGETPAVADISLAALQPLGEEYPTIVTVPVFRNSVPNVETSATPAGGSCPSGTDCVTYRLFVAASNPAVGVFNTSLPTTYTAPPSSEVEYWVNAQAFVPMSANSRPGSPDCVPASLPAAFDATTELTVTPATDTTQNFNFTGCRQ
jgi:hypothetical protein